MNNKVKGKIKNGEQVLGAFVGIYSPAVVEMLAFAGFEFIVIDDEHGTFSHSELENMIRTADSVNLIPIVRVSYDSSSIQKALDRGAKGIHVPMVNKKEDALSVVKRAKYPPIGERGAAYSIRAARFGKDTGKEYIDAANRDIFIAVHIETREAAQNFEEIMGVDGIDLAFLGPTDLSVSMGYPTEGASHPEVQQTLSQLYERGRKLGVPIGTIAGNAEAALKAFNQGADYVGVVATAVMTTEFTKVAHSVKETLSNQLSIER
jgi:4-hydroxy-2-oxoheptanedioate aldolase